MGQGIWTETGGEKEHQEYLQRVREKEIETVMGLAKCPVCGGRAEAYKFGIDKNGIWIGCIRSPECARNVEYHTEGWSLYEVASDWNRKNRGFNLIIRKVKGWVRRKVGKGSRIARKIAKDQDKQKKEAQKRREEVFNKGK